jgi:osmotically-inducible protein OsmY
VIPVTASPYHGDDRRPPAERLAGRPDHDDVVAKLLVGGLLGDQAVRAGRLDILVQNGVAILDGSVPTEGVRCAILRRAWATPGVRDVCDLLTVDDGADWP